MTLDPGHADPARRDARPVLLVFTLGPDEEQRRRPLLRTGDGSLERTLRSRCLDAALDAGRGAGCRLLVSSPTALDLGPDVEWLAQPGEGFADRLRTALAAARATTTGPLVVVPSDVPDLRVDHVRSALDTLRRRPEDVVVGPDIDGGIYLLGGHGALDDLVANVVWQRGDTRHSLEAAIAAMGRPVARLPALGDLDHRGDLTRWLRRAEASSRAWWQLIGRLRTWLAACCQPRIEVRLVPIGIGRRPTEPVRGPPRR